LKQFQSLGNGNTIRFHGFLPKTLHLPRLPTSGAQLPLAMNAIRFQSLTFAAERADMKRHSFVCKTNTSLRALTMGMATVLMSASPLLITTPARAGVAIGIGISINIAPPPLPIYVQPPLPALGYIWVPGYWAWADDGYYWVPGTWVQPPFVGALWTPGYWGWVNGVYVFHEGYWGPHVGFYGGINYGYGYTGDGYAGGRWGPGGFYYNQTVNQFGGVHVTNVYNQTVVNNVTVNHVSYNGGQGGVAAQPTPQQQAFAQEQHTPPVAEQQQHVAMAAQNPALRAANNHGNPSIAATSTPAHFSGPGIVGARGASPATDVEHPNAAPAPAEHAVEPSPRAPAATPLNHPSAPAPEHVPPPQPEARPAPMPEQHPAAPVAPVNHAPAQPTYQPAAPPRHEAAPRPEAKPKPPAHPPKDEHDHN
jgi:hypothetical protein